jgi:hypothetical protein
MPVATTTLIAAGLVGGAILKAGHDAKQAANEMKKAGPIVTLPEPVYEKPDFARAVKLQRARATGASGRAGTIKTGPRGIVNAPAATPKTLIGE